MNNDSLFALVHATAFFSSKGHGKFLVRYCKIPVTTRTIKAPKNI